MLHMMTNSKTAMALLTGVCTFAMTTGPALAVDWDNLWSKPYVKQAAIGAAVGAGAGVLTDRVSVGKGALVGGLVGAGTGYMDTNRTLQRNPLVRSTLKGALIGTGTGYATDNGALKGGLIGAGVGAGTHYVRKYVLDR